MVTRVPYHHIHISRCNNRTQQRGENIELERDLIHRHGHIEEKLQKQTYFFLRCTLTGSPKHAYCFCVRSCTCSDVYCRTCFILSFYNGGHLYVHFSHFCFCLSHYPSRCLRQAVGKQRFASATNHLAWQNKCTSIIMAEAHTQKN